MNRIASRQITGRRVLTRGFSVSSISRDVAKMTLVGRLGFDIEKNESANGVSYYRYAVAVKLNRNMDTSWYNVVSFDKNAEYLLNLKKGDMVYVEATPSMQYSTDANGERRSNLSLIHRNITRLSPSKSAATTEEAESQA
ncbi:uncharacterized protein V1516DRAFT_673707 [Lipomyces oligophaga]|uniref:uncharacterized protein n=1 Tax=Lipomyces oligophaga TaxID=45792 RepID=UPI0034CFD451